MIFRAIIIFRHLPAQSSSSSPPKTPPSSRRSTRKHRFPLTRDPLTSRTAGRQRSHSSLQAAAMKQAAKGTSGICDHHDDDDDYDDDDDDDIYIVVFNII